MRTRLLALSITTCLLVLVGAHSASAGGDSDRPGPVIGEGTIGTGTFVGAPGGGASPGGGGSPLVGTWVDTFLGICFDSGGEILIIPIGFPFLPILPLPVGDLSGEPGGFVIHHSLMSPEGVELADYVENQCDPVSPPAPEPPPTFDQIFRAIALPVPAMVTSPHVDGLVGLQNWFWWEAVEGGSPLSDGVSVQLGQWVASGSATLSKVVWDLGNSDTVTAYEEELPGSEQDPAARYTYQFEDMYTITATAYWTVSFTLGNPTLGISISQGTGWTTTSNSRDYQVHEVQAVGEDA